MSAPTVPTGISLAKFLSGLDWQALLFVGLVLAAVLYLFRLDRDPGIRFRLVHFITDHDGFGNSASLAYVVALLVSTWALFYLTTHNRLEEWFFAGYIGVFVGGGVLRAAIGSRERTAALTRPAGATTETTTRSTTVTDAQPSP